MQHDEVNDWADYCHLVWKIIKKIISDNFNRFYWAETERRKTDGQRAVHNWYFHLSLILCILFYIFVFLPTTFIL